MVLLFVVYCLPCSPNREHLKGRSQAVFILVFLAPPTVPGPGRCHISALCLRPGLRTVVLLIPPARRALVQPEKESALPSKFGIWGLLALEPKKTQGVGNLSAVGTGSPQRGLWGPPALGRRHLGSHLEARAGVRGRSMQRATAHAVSRAVPDGGGLAGFRGSKVHRRIHNGALTCLELGSLEELGTEGRGPSLVLDCVHAPAEQAGFQAA